MGLLRATLSRSSRRLRRDLDGERIWRARRGSDVICPSGRTSGKFEPVQAAPSGLPRLTVVRLQPVHHRDPCAQCGRQDPQKTWEHLL